MIRNIIFSIIISFTMLSCAISKAIYLGSDDYTRRTPSSISAENRIMENINGIFPETVYIKTRTQTFNTYHYYILYEGRIWFKSINSENEPNNWTLFMSTGLPHKTSGINFNRTNEIVEISADADELMALSIEGYIYSYRFDLTPSLNAKTWKDRQGWPVEESLYFDHRCSKNRSWALGRRNSHVLYYEDIFGNEHHWGINGISTIYILLEDGQEICYGDSGLPGDFSRNFIGPERGSFKAVSLSASASTMFLINDAGEMYTRLVDFDTIGKDPLFFDYTYNKKVSDLSGTDIRSCFSEWGLPAEDWRSQQRIPLAGNAAITRHITILQNGHGNSARELRVAGLNEKGETGYWSKQIFGETWEFKTTQLYFDNETILMTAETFDINKQGERGLSLDKSYSGFSWNNKIKDNGWEYQIKNFNLLEGDCDLLITFNGETCILKLHPIEMWTYIKRDYLPGRTGHPKLFFVTLEIPENAFNTLSFSFTQLLNNKYTINNKKLFHYIITATDKYIIMRELNNNDSLLFLTDGTISGDYSEIHFGRYIENFKEVEYYYSPELTIKNDNNLTVEELNEKILLNRQFISELKYKIRVMKWSQLTTFKFNSGYLPAHYLARFTPFSYFNTPIRTITSYGEKIILENNDFINKTVNARIWLYENIIEMLETRIHCYNDITKEILKTSSTISHLPAYYSENIYDYWAIAGLPQIITGTFYSPGERNQTIQKQAKLSFVNLQSQRNISGWYLAITDNLNPNSDGFSIFLDPRNSIKKNYSRRGKSPEERKFQFECILHINYGANNPTEQDVIENCLKPFFNGINKNINVRISFDGRNFEIREYPAKRGNSLIFKGI